MLWSIPSAAMGAFQIFFVLQRRADTSPQVIIKTIFLVFQSLGRLIGMPLCGSILFFQGWRLDPILQFGVMLLGIGIVVESFGVMLLGIGIVVESFGGILGDYQKWRARTGRATANIAVKHQPIDDV